MATSSFVRKGAMARCAQCGRDYLVKPETYRRLATIEAPDSLESVAATAPAPLTATAGSATGAPPAPSPAPTASRPPAATPTVRAT
ncbi:MAG: hypothetical protein NTW19_21825, partial [Planctomycetota bacterium]|nr:hypothetical protein [Planctomycetota bacterium]